MHECMILKLGGKYQYYELEGQRERKGYGNMEISEYVFTDEM